VHAGWHKIWEDVRRSSLSALRDVGCEPGSHNIRMTGHSLGGAIAHLAMFALEGSGYEVAMSHTFEAPRVGNTAFSKEFSRRFTRRFPVFRITHHRDPVPHLPAKFMRYRQVETEVYYNSSGAFRICAGPEDKTCSSKFNFIGDIMRHIGDHCGSPLGPNGNLCGPICGPIGGAKELERGGGLEVDQILV